MSDPGQLVHGLAAFVVFAPAREVAAFPQLDFGTLVELGAGDFLLLVRLNVVVKLTNDDVVDSGAVRVRVEAAKLW